MQKNEANKTLLSLKDIIVENFSQENWLELGVATDADDVISRHPRLLRSLSWGDQDYAGAVLDVLLTMVRRDPGNIDAVSRYVGERFSAGGKYISSGADDPKRRIYFSPNVFNVPVESLDENLICAMMPFDRRFDAVFAAIREAAESSGFICKRVDDIWEHSTVVQDIFSLIFRSFIVVCDFSGRSPNVFYEAGIAHTLGKHVVPMTQSADDIPFDLRHHRYLHYLDNAEGRAKLSAELKNRFSYLREAKGD